MNIQIELPEGTTEIQAMAIKNALQTIVNKGEPANIQFLAELCGYKDINAKLNKNKTLIRLKLK